MSPLMSEETFAGHAVHENLTVASEKLDALLEAKIAANELPARAIALLRCGAVLPFLRARLETSLHHLVDSSDLSELNEALSGLVGAIDQLKIDNDDTAAAGTVERLLAQMVRTALGLPTISNVADTTALAEGIDKARRKIIGSLSAFGRQAGSLREELTTLRSTQRALQATIEATTTQINQKVSGAEQRFDSLITDQQQKFSDTQAAQAEKFSAAAEDRAKTHKATLSALQEEQAELAEKFESESADTIARVKGQFEELIESTKRDVGLLVQELNKQRDEATRLVGIIGTSGMTGAYQQRANVARIEKYVWSVVTVLAFVALVVIVLWKFEPIHELSWGLVTIRILIALTMVGLAGFAGVEARRAGDTERRYRRMELELAAIGPYLADFPPEESRVIRQKLADKVFGAPDVGFESPAAHSEPGVVDILKAVAQLVTKLTP